MLVREAMSSPPTFIRSGVTLQAAAGVLLAAGVAAAPVVDDHGDLVGIVTELDLLRAMSEPDYRAHEIPLARPAQRPALVDDIMTRDVVAVLPGADLDDVISIMATQHFTAVPVMDGRRVVGVLLRHDVLRLLVAASPVVRAHPELAERPPVPVPVRGRRLP